MAPNNRAALPPGAAYARAVDDACAATGLSQRELGKRINYDHSTISRYRSGELMAPEQFPKALDDFMVTERGGEPGATSEPLLQARARALADPTSPRARKTRLHAQIAEYGRELQRTAQRETELIEQIWQLRRQLALTQEELASNQRLIAQLQRELNDLRRQRAQIEVRLPQLEASLRVLEASEDQLTPDDESGALRTHDPRHPSAFVSQTAPSAPSWWEHERVLKALSGWTASFFGLVWIAAVMLNKLATQPSTGFARSPGLVLACTLAQLIAPPVCVLAMRLAVLVHGREARANAQRRIGRLRQVLDPDQ